MWAHIEVRNFGFSGFDFSLNARKKYRGNARSHVVILHNVSHNDVIANAR